MTEYRNTLVRIIGQLAYGVLEIICSQLRPPVAFEAVLCWTQWVPGLKIGEHLCRQCLLYDFVNYG